MKIVLDTNVLVSGLLKPFSSSGEIVRMISSGVLEICYDARVLSEYREVLGRPKFMFSEERVDDLLEQIKDGGELVHGVPLPKPLPDPDDEAFLEIALEARITHLITGNLKHYPPPLCQGINIVSPSQFLKDYRDE